MFTPPRFIVVDDRPEHLTEILGVFQNLGTPCLGITYDPNRGLDKQSFEGVRALFLDLHLTDDTITTNKSQHFAVIAGLLEDNINPTGGPFILVIWTEHEHEVEDLKAYLDEPNVIKESHTRPLAIVGLKKSRFINVNTGELREGRADALRTAVEGAVSEKPQLVALLSWEIDVQAAVGATLATLMELVPGEKRNSGSFAEGLDEVLTRLAREAVGESHVSSDPRTAILSALTPIFADRIVNQHASEAASEAWQRALTWEGSGKLDSATSGTVNCMLHVAAPPSETIRSTDWGAVVEFPESWWGDELQNHLGVTREQLLENEYKLKPEDREGCLPKLIRIGAVCDYAQNRPGPITYLFGLEIPVTVRRRGKSPASEWSSPTLIVNSEDDPFNLVVNARYALNVVPNETRDWRPVYRLREQLLMHLISHVGSYLSRPGIVQS